MPLLSALNLGSLLSALGLVSSLVKPVPIVGGVASGLLGAVAPVAQSTFGGLSPILASVDGGDAAPAAPPAPVCNPITSYENSSVPLQGFAPFDASMANVFRYRQQQSVNLGAWFVQEAWMHPSLMVCTGGKKDSELDLAMGYGGDLESARMALEMHWDSWITEADFAYLQKIGINTVRIPIGYWSLGPVYMAGTPFEPVSSVYTNSWPRVVRAVNWAAKYGLGVLIDLHGAPGSQNGQGHGGTSDGITGLFDSPDYMDKTINILTFLTQQFVEVTNVVGIELLNEPLNVDGLPDFYTRALTTLRQVSPSAQRFPFYLHDGFDMSRIADYVHTRSDFVVLDHHQYFVFSPEDNAKSSTMLAVDVRTNVSTSLLSATNRARGNLVVDEYSCALQSSALDADADKDAARQTYCTGQMETYANGTAGWSFWSYKTESCATDQDWCFSNAVGKSLPSSFFSYPGNYPTIPSPNGPPSTSDSPVVIPGILSPFSPVAKALKAIQVPSSAAVLAYADPASSGEVLAALNSNLVVSELADVDDHVFGQPSTATITSTPAGTTASALPSAFMPAPSLSNPTHNPAPALLATHNSTKNETSSQIPPPMSAFTPRPGQHGMKRRAGHQATFHVPGKFSVREQRALAARQLSELDAASILSSSPSLPIPTPTSTSSSLPSSVPSSIPPSIPSLAPLSVPSSIPSILPSSVSSSIPSSIISPSSISSSAASAPSSIPSSIPTSTSTPSFGVASAPAPSVSLTAAQSATTKAYSDGFQTAKVFALQSGSRLGFTTQYITDTLGALSSVIPAAQHDTYVDWFLKGLADGETQVAAVLARSDKTGSILVAVLPETLM